ncbi:anaerobic ribonucleoside-triphosphate reductase activating protein [Peptostreptococcus faecalis]|uniref:anaerobic ribonucleoside-triphosphate reductase activating protein n=1 Tax=Peptostreptococcus faecalis TaxID=2045015 RepID=UPI000C7D7EB4|nr:anaerobic ribonucleoside-triphosphate reductase activating protein [Peptostreptococcus faecalis]
MNYHNITTDDMLNGEGLRTVLWVAGCSHGCPSCHNKETWDTNSGIEFDANAMVELMYKVKKSYISGLTLSGGDPFHLGNRKEVSEIIKFFKETNPNKTIWVYTGYRYEELMRTPDLLKYIDVLVDGKFEQEKADLNYKYAGSTNQRVIDVQKSLKENKIILYGEKNELYK